jgi:hypothetical protein
MATRSAGLDPRDLVRPESRTLNSKAGGNQL